MNDTNDVTHVTKHVYMNNAKWSHWQIQRNYINCKYWLGYYTKQIQQFFITILTHKNKLLKNELSNGSYHKLYHDWNIT